MRIPETYLSTLLFKVSGSEGEEMVDVPLRRTGKAVSLAAGLNTLHLEEDEPDGEASTGGQTSFLHSKCKTIITYMSQK